MKCQALFSLKNTRRIKMSRAAVAISTLRLTKLILICVCMYVSRRQSNEQHEENNTFGFYCHVSFYKQDDIMAGFKSCRPFVHLFCQH